MCFLPNTTDPNNTSKLCASVVAGVCSRGAEREQGKGSWRKGQRSDRARLKNKAALLIHLSKSSESFLWAVCVCVCVCVRSLREGKVQEVKDRERGFGVGLV